MRIRGRPNDRQALHLARRNRLLGLWLAQLLGRGGEAEAYAAAFVASIADGENKQVPRLRSK